MKRAAAILLLLMAAGCVSSTAPARTAAPNREILANVFGEGFASQQELDAAVHQKYDDANRQAPFDSFSTNVIRFAPYLLRTGTLGVHPVADVLKCYFTYDNKFKSELKKQKKKHPGAAMTIVLVKTGDSGVGACAMAKDLIVTSEYVDADALTHELGHAFGGLKDERPTDGAHQHDSQNPYKQPNCAEDRAAPGWTYLDDQGANLLPEAGCGGFSTCVYKPSHGCRMFDYDLDFDCVCMKFMVRHVVDVLNLPSSFSDAHCTIPAAEAAKPAIIGTYVTAEFGNGASSEIEIGESATVAPPIVAGDSFVTLIAGTTAIATEALPDPPTVARAYKPIRHAIDQKVDAPLPAIVTLFVPGIIPLTPIKHAIFPIHDLSGTQRLDAAISRINFIIDTTGIPP